MIHSSILNLGYFIIISFVYINNFWLRNFVIIESHIQKVIIIHIHFIMFIIVPHVDSCIYSLLFEKIVHSLIINIVVIKEIVSALGITVIGSYHY